MKNSNLIYIKDFFDIMKLKLKNKLKEFIYEAKHSKSNNAYIEFIKAIKIENINNDDYKLTINNFNKKLLHSIKKETEKLISKKNELEKNEINSYIEEISNNIDIDNLPIVCILAIASNDNITSNELKKINNIVLLENKNLIYLKDLVNLFGNNFINTINDLVNKLNNIGYEIQIAEDKNTIKINNLIDEELKKLKEETINFIIKEKNESKKDFQNYLDKLDKLEYNFDSFDFPFLYLLIILRHFISDEDIYNYSINVGIDIDIINLIFADTRIYNIYLDESGEIISNKKFLIGGYFIEGINFDYWKQHTKKFFNNIKNKYEGKLSDKEVIYHRNTIKDDKIKTSITYDIFNFLKINGGKFICIYEDKVKKSLFSRQYYVTLVSELIMSTLRSIINKKKIDLRNEKLLLIIKMAYRTYEDKYDNVTFRFKDVEKFLQNAVNSKIEIQEILKRWKKDNYKYITKERYMEKLDISPIIYDSIEQSRIKYGLNSENIDYKILNFEIADNSSDLAIADYFCNSYLTLNYNNNTKKLMNNFQHMIYTNIEYNPLGDEIDFFLMIKDYYNILKKYIIYKKISDSNRVSSSTKEYSQQLVKRITKYFQDEDHRNKNRYIVAALKSILENIEYESNFLRNYSDILHSYGVLIDLVKKDILTNNVYLNKAIIFTINTEKLAVYNHSDNDEKACEIVYDNNNNYREYVFKSIDFRDRVLLFDNISSIVYWYQYDAEASINALNETLLNQDMKIENYDRAKLYGTLGQSYNVNYYVTNNKDDLINAQKALMESIKYFENNNFDIIREYSYLQNVAISAKNEDSFLEYTEEYLNLISDNYKSIEKLNDKIDTYLSQSNKDKGYEFFVIRLLRYCNTFEITKEPKEIANLLMTNHKHFIEDNIISLEDVDIQKEYGLLLYKYNDGEIDTQYLKKCYSFMKGKSGTFNDMRMLSLYLIEILMDNESNIDKALEIISDLSKITGAGYKKAFDGLHDKASIGDIKEWASNVRDKLYM